jgi:hypothetical protein
MAICLSYNPYRRLRRRPPPAFCGTDILRARVTAVELPPTVPPGAPSASVTKRPFLFLSPRIWSCRPRGSPCCGAVPLSWSACGLWSCICRFKGDVYFIIAAINKFFNGHMRPFGWQVRCRCSTSTCTVAAVWWPGCLPRPKAKGY